VTVPPSGPPHPSAEGGAADPGESRVPVHPGARWGVLPFRLHAFRLGRGRSWGVTRPDAWLAGAVAVATVGIVLAAPATGPYRPVDALAVVLAAAGPVALLWRQVVPLAALAGSGLVVVANAAAGYNIGYLQWSCYICLFTCFALGGRRVRGAAAAVAGLLAAGYLVFDRGGVDADLLSSIATSYLVAAIAGQATRGLLRTAAAGARLVDESRQQALTAERLLAQERGRLARELHDSLGHTVNVMVLQAGVGRRVFDDNPKYSHEALATIETVGRGALDELDRLLRVLQPAERDGTREPFAPTIADLEELAGRIRATGRQVDLRTDGVELTASSARAVYRIIQEALTNAVRHSSTGRIAVEVSGADGQILLDVTNEGRQFHEPVPGRGLVNMRERARLEGGRLEAGPIDGAFRVRAMLPVDSAVGA
jgi:signal transduction histidine kinase